MIRFALPLPGPFVWLPGIPRRPRPAKPLRRTVAYWLFGGWVIEASVWVTIYAAVFAIYVAVAVVQLLVVGVCLVGAALARWHVQLMADRIGGKHRRVVR